MAFSTDHLYKILISLPQAERCWIAYSGGMDSLTLLHAVAALRSQLGFQLTAIHINHDLQEQAASWEQHCIQQCQRLDIPIVTKTVEVNHQPGESLEAAAREVRYLAIAAEMQAGDLLLTAHHRDDQAETLLLQLLRGSGLSGLSAMPVSAPFGSGIHARPLLGFDRSELEQYAQQQGLRWLEDPSNQSTSFDRNYLRHEIIPQLQSRWPALSRTFSRSARHCAEAQSLIDTLAEQDLGPLIDSELATLPLSVLTNLPPPRIRAVLRLWIRRCGFPLPDTVHLDRILQEAIGAGADKTPLVQWSDVELRRYRDKLYLMQSSLPTDSDWEREWDGKEPLTLPGNMGSLQMQKGSGGISFESWQQGRVTVGFRQGGERCRLAGKKHSQPLKKLFQESGFPPWLRHCQPLLRIDGIIAAIGDYWFCEPFVAADDEPGVHLKWDRSDRYSLRT